MESNIGIGWLIDEVDGLVDELHHITPSEFNEKYRYLPASVTKIPGYLRYSNTPMLREIVDCFDVQSPIREVNVKKGVQVAYSTMLESIFLYAMAHVKTDPIMFITADKELAKARVENNFIPMLQQSGFAHLLRSSDEGNARKSGKTVDHWQWEGGGYMVPFGAINANKMRSFSIRWMLKDEISGWPKVVGRDGNPHRLTDDRCAAYWDQRKIFRGGTCLLLPNDPADVEYKRGDQRKYMVRCLSCNFRQEIRWRGINKKTGHVYGFIWEMNEGSLLLDSVRWVCAECAHAHNDYDKDRLFSPDHGAEWVPTAKPENPFIRSYHLPAFYAPLQPWHKQVTTWLAAWDVEADKVKDVGALQTFYNNVLAEPFEITGDKIRFITVSAHRRAVYRLGQIPNRYAAQHSVSKILFITCHVDVQKRDLAVSVFGWCRDSICYTIDYWRFGGDDCTQLSDAAWQRLREVIEEKLYTADDGTQYRVVMTTVDAGYANDTVVQFCSAYSTGVYPILGRDRPAKAQRIQEFAEFTTATGTVGYRILVDHYKDRNAPVLRREWVEESGPQKPYHFNAPVDIPDKALKELTVESRREKTDDRGQTVHYWHRPQGAPNELWDLFQYGSATVEIIAFRVCTEHLGLENVDWLQFWDYAESNPGEIFRVEPIDGPVNSN